MKTVKVDFKFEIGDIVEPYIAGYGRRYMILERIFQECIGGYQIHYQVRNMIWDLIFSPVNIKTSRLKTRMPTSKNLGLNIIKKMNCIDYCSIPTLLLIQQSAKKKKRTLPE
ncbi:hypothetical protein LCGC14_2899840 [marine sediment metagenome]|uniref:Uncharacterized protein n=1 Tax=marine sediment metagenome TaxID=412755 RepID=A0A0F8XV38_9ZZZZ